MLTKLFDRIIQESKAEIINIDGLRPHCQKKIEPIKNRPTPTQMHTLQGLIAFANQQRLLNGNMELSFSIRGPNCVALERYDIKWEEYFPIATAVCFSSNNPFRFGEKYDTETFIVRLQAEFADTEDKLELLKLVSKLTSGVTQAHEDDGISQKVTIKKGVSLKDEKVINPRVHLMPYRTFQEVSQPESNYIFRVYSDGAEPRVALHEAEGGIWQHQAVMNIYEWLSMNVNAEHFSIFF